MARGDQAVWGDILAHLRAHHVSMCRQWFDEIEPLGVDTGVLSLRVNHGVRRAYLERECQRTFAEAAQSVTGRLLSVRFLGPDDELPAPAGGSPSMSSQAPGAGAGAGRSSVGNGRSQGSGGLVGGQSRSMVEPKPQVHGGVGGVGGGSAGQGPFAPPPSWASTAMQRANGIQDRLRLSPDHSFDNFVVGPGNRLAHAAATAVADNPGNAYNPLFFHGGVGLGKTHLLQAICLRLLERDPSTRIHYNSCEEFLSGFVEAVRQGDMSSFHHAFRDADVLVIDDIHFLAKGESAQEEFFHTFNALYQQRKQLVLSSDASPEQIPQLEERLISRFKWGLVVEIEPPNTDTRAAIVRQKAGMRGVEMPDDVARFVAERISANIRELEGAVVRLQIQSQVEKKPIDLALAKSALGEAPGKARPVLSVMTIVQTVGDYYSVKVSDLQSRRKQKSIVQPRQICMFLARKHTRHSLEEIGGYLGGRDHTTVMHALSTVDARLKQEPSLLAELQAIEQKLLSLEPA